MGGYLAGPMVVPRLMHLSPPSTGIFEAASGIIDTPPCSTESLIPTAGCCGTLVPVTARLSSFLKQAKRRPFREVICRWGCLPKQHIRIVELLCRGVVQSLCTPTE